MDGMRKTGESVFSRHLALMAWAVIPALLVGGGVLSLVRDFLSK